MSYLKKKLFGKKQSFGGLKWKTKKQKKKEARAAAQAIKDRQTLKRKDALPAFDGSNRKESKEDREQQQQQQQQEERETDEEKHERRIMEGLLSFYRDPYYVDHPVYGRLRY